MDVDPPNPQSGQEKQLQIKLKTTQETYAVPDSTLSIPENVDPEKLNQLIKSLLTDKVENVPDFDFFLSDDLLRTTLKDFIQGKICHTLSITCVDAPLFHPHKRLGSTPTFPFRYQMQCRRVSQNANVGRR